MVPFFTWRSRLVLIVPSPRCERGLGHVDQRDLPPVLREDVGDPVSHGPRSDHRRPAHATTSFVVRRAATTAPARRQSAPMSSALGSKGAAGEPAPVPRRNNRARASGSGSPLTGAASAASARFQPRCAPVAVHNPPGVKKARPRKTPASAMLATASPVTPGFEQVPQPEEQRQPDDRRDPPEGAARGPAAERRGTSAPRRARRGAARRRSRAPTPASSTPPHRPHATSPGRAATAMTIASRGEHRADAETPAKAVEAPAAPARSPKSSAHGGRRIRPPTSQVITPKPTSSTSDCRAASQSALPGEARRGRARDEVQQKEG